ncbi:MAG TPA: ribonuclease Z [Acidimicrobiales bacterium]|nr:ribonuclease Z [Acidimicrobiales bacterium]
MSGRRMVVLGTASQAPTRHRNHNGYLLLLDDRAVLFDPGEGTQRQMLHAGVPASRLWCICVTHFHGDHCLGLPGVIARLALDQVDHPVEAYFPAAGSVFFERLRGAAVSRPFDGLVPRPVAGTDGLVEVGRVGTWRLRAARLDHGTATVGWRLDEPAGVRMLPDRLESAGVAGPAVAELMRDGRLRVGGRTVHLEEVSEARPGQSVAFVMDTRPCEGAALLAAGVDLLVCESTFLSGEAGLAEEYGHMTARQAAELAAGAGARRLLLTHFSQRHPDEAAFAAEAAPVFEAVTAAVDLMEVPLPPRRPPTGAGRGG